MPKKSGVRSELRKIYKRAWKDGIFVCEFCPGNGYLAAAGSVKRVEAMEKRLGHEIDIAKLTIAQCMDLGASPGHGSSRRKACLEAIANHRKTRGQK